MSQLTFVGLQNVLKMFSRPFPRRLEDVSEDKILLRCRHLEDVLKACLEEVLKTYLDGVTKTSWRQTKCLLVTSVSNKSKCVFNKSMFYKSISDKSKANPKYVT